MSLLKLFQVFAFIVVTLVVALIAFRQYGRIYRNISKGKAVEADDNIGLRIKNTVLLAFGQKKMFQNMIPAVLHLFIYVAFLFTQIELIEIIIDGFTGKHRVFADSLGMLYPTIISFIELLSFLALIATVAFLWRRNKLKIPRFQMSEMNGWPKLDANLILIAEIVLVTCIFTMNGADVVMQGHDPAHYPDTGYLAISSWLGPLLFGWMPEGVVALLERVGWWGHLLTVYAFIIYLPFSKHLHIMLAFPNTYFASLEKKGKMTHMPSITNEIQMMMNPDAPMDAGADEEEVPGFGAKDVEELDWVQLLSAYSCTECGRCTSSCPANQTGKKLSPRKVMMDVRDRMEEKADNEAKHGVGFDDGKSLFDYITKEEINACTTCNACVEECPISINPLSIILELRRHKIMEEADSSEEWNLMFTNTENNQAVWQFSPTERDKWRADL